MSQLCLTADVLLALYQKNVLTTTTISENKITLFKNENPFQTAGGGEKAESSVGQTQPALCFLQNSLQSRPHATASGKVMLEHVTHHNNGHQWHANHPPQDQTA